MKKLYSGFLLAVFSLSVQAGEVTFTGKGVVEKKPEWLSVEIVVQSECFKKPKEAMEENDLKVLEIQKFLGGLKYESDHDSVCTHAGSTRPFSRIKGYGDNQVTECKNTFQKTTRIIFTTADIKDFYIKFATLQDEVLNSYSSEGEGDASRSYATISEPTSGVSDETRELMKKEALRIAIREARSLFDVYAEECQIEGPVTWTHPEGKNQSANYEGDYSPKSGALRMGREAVTLNYAAITESWSLPVTYHFPSPSFSVCKLPKK